MRAIAETGVDYASLGALTKNAQAMDLSIRLSLQALHAPQLGAAKNYLRGHRGVKTRLDRQPGQNAPLQRVNSAYSGLFLPCTDCLAYFRGAQLWGITPRNRLTTLANPVRHDES